MVDRVENTYLIPSYQKIAIFVEVEEMKGGGKGGLFRCLL